MLRILQLVGRHSCWVLSCTPLNHISKICTDWYNIKCFIKHLDGTWCTNSEIYEGYGLVVRAFVIKRSQVLAPQGPYYGIEPYPYCSSTGSFQEQTSACFRYAQGSCTNSMCFRHVYKPTRNLWNCLTASSYDSAQLCINSEKTKFYQKHQKNPGLFSMLYFWNCHKSYSCIVIHCCQNWPGHCSL